MTNKILFATDIHGSLLATKQLIEIISIEKPQRIILLGDIYYHGPRNALPESYAPMQVSELLKSIKIPIVFIKGNCDSEVDEMISGTPFLRSYTVKSHRKILCVHGHRLNEQIEKLKPEFIIFGHTHENSIREINGCTAIGISSLAIPKNGAEKSYAILFDGVITTKTVGGKIIGRVIL